jgi:WD40 repeat protein
MMKSKIVIGWLVFLAAMVVVTGCQATNQSSAADLMFCADQAVFSVTLGNDSKTEMHKVVDLPEDATCPVWSPDGKFAVLYRYRQIEPFVQEDSLSLIDRQTGTIREVYRFGPGDDEWAIHWLPDGADLIVASAQAKLKDATIKCNPSVRSFNNLYGLECWKGYADFYRGKLSPKDGLVGLDRLTHSPMMRCSLEWSPDGSKLAFTHGSLCSEGAGEEGNISLLDLDKHTESIIVDAAAYIANHRGGFDRNEAISWSPRGEPLAILDYRYDGEVSTSQVSIAGATGVRPILSEQVYPVGWLPDGKRFLWFGKSFGITDIENGKVETMPISIDPQYSVGNIALSPNGRHIAWRETNDQDKTGQIRIYDFAKNTTSTVLNVTPGTLVWSPDSQLLAFPVKTQLKPNSCDYQIDIYVVKPDATRLRNLTEGQQMQSLPCRFSGGMGWRWYDRFMKDVQWVPHS